MGKIDESKLSGASIDYGLRQVPEYGSYLRFYHRLGILPQKINNKGCADDECAAPSMQTDLGTEI